MIEIAKLTEEDKGREVVFDSSGVKREFGIISSWNNRFIFVKYNGSQQSQATMPEDLRFSIGAEKTNDQLALAKVGIDALIDEATGYQDVREKDALNKLHQGYLGKAGKGLNEKDI
jgi:hypothetical protein